MSKLVRNAGNGLTRRNLLKGAALGAAALSVPATVRSAFAQGDGTVRVGFIGPRSGPLGIFGEGDSFLVEQVGRHLADGIQSGDRRYGLQLVLGDTQSDPVRAAQVARDMINSENLDLVITSSTPETVNPVADACEAAGMPCLSTTAPWESFYFGRGARPGEPSPFRWTYHFCFGVGNFTRLYADQWSQVETNRRVGILAPNDADGNAIRMMLLPELEAAGFTIIDAGPYENGTTDFTQQINLFRSENCEIFNCFPFPPDFPVFWRQAAQRGYAQQVKVCQMAKAGLFAAELEALGPLGYGLHAGAYWHPLFPFTSSSTGLTCEMLAAAHEGVVGKQWNQQLGANASLLDATVAAIASASDPKDKTAMASALSMLKCDTAVGEIDFTSGPVANCATTGLVGVQWVKAESGPYEFDLNIVSNADHPFVPVTGQMTSYTVQG
ncbi:ABC transporter substrate-binding protein [Pelagibacterium limicola]|uniref:ABC transporter substrate-binding protein n=1 Tax=Pelagibacterium limicola TaxID=2791022 RepID=UPI0018B007F8|nr:ABC transporter substrate-binding protein [Pelagibacterium limicola]